MTSGSGRRTATKKGPAGGRGRGAARSPAAAPVKERPADRAEKTKAAPPPPGTASATAAAEDTAGAAAGGGDGAAAGAPRVSSGIVPFLWTVLALAVLGGAAYGTWPLWSPYLGARPSATEEDPFKDPRMTGLVGRIKALEEMTRAAGDGGNAVRDLEAERARSREQLNALMKRLAVLEQKLGTVRKMVEATAPPAEGAGAGTSLQELAERLGRLEENDQTLATLRERIARLEETGGAPAKGGDPAAESARLSAELADISRRVGALEKTEGAAAGAPIGAQATVLAVGQLREALRTAAPFAKELQALEALVADNAEMMKAIARLKPYAAAGIPTLVVLRRDFDAVAARIVHAAGALEGNGWVERTLNRLASLVTVRRTGDARDLNSVDAKVARAETSLRAGGLKAAVEELEGLNGPAAAAAAAWLKAARARLVAERAMATLHVQAVSLLVPAKE